MNTLDNNENLPGENREPDVLRAKDIFPAPVKPAPQSHNIDNPKNNLEADFKIPKFDLAEQILARQRKISATSRKSPAEKTETSGSQPVADSIHQAALRYDTCFPQHDLIIIKEIVTQDIEQLCRGRKT